MRLQPYVYIYIYIYTHLFSCLPIRACAKLFSTTLLQLACLPAPKSLVGRGHGFLKTHPTDTTFAATVARGNQRKMNALGGYQDKVDRNLASFLIFPGFPVN